MLASWEKFWLFLVVLLYIYTYIIAQKPNSIPIILSCNPFLHTVTVLIVTNLINYKRIQEFSRPKVTSKSNSEFSFSSWLSKVFFLSKNLSFSSILSIEYGVFNQKKFYFQLQYPYRLCYSPKSCAFDMCPIPLNFYDELGTVNFSFKMKFLFIHCFILELPCVT